MHISTPFSDPFVQGSIDAHVILNTLVDAIDSQNEKQLETLFRKAKNTRDSWID